MVKIPGNNDTELNFFETGYIMIGGKRYDVEEISINQSRDMNPYHVASQRDPIAQRPGRNKIDFSFKRAFGDTIFAKIYQSACTFDMVLLNNDQKSDGESGTAIIELKGCRLSQLNIGPINGGDIVSEDIQGSATQIVYDICQIKNDLDNACDMKCANGESPSYNNTIDLSRVVAR